MKQLIRLRTSRVSRVSCPALQRLKRMSNASDHYVLLRDGLALPLEPVRLTLDLESRGFKLERADEDIAIRPASRLTDEDRAAIRRWKFHILAIVDRCDDVQ